MALIGREMALLDLILALSPTLRFRNTFSLVVGKDHGCGVLVVNGCWYASGSPEWIVVSPSWDTGWRCFGRSLLIDFSCHFCHFCHNCPDPKLSEGRSSFEDRSCHFCPASAITAITAISAPVHQCGPPTGPRWAEWIVLAPVSGYGAGSRIEVRGERCFGRRKTFLILPAPSAPSAPAKAKGESVQLWDRVHFREIVSAPSAPPAPSALLSTLRGHGFSQ